MRDFVQLPGVLSKDARADARAAFEGARELAAAPSPVDIADGENAAWVLVSNVTAHGQAVLDGYEALLVRARLAELALFRFRALKQDLTAHVEREAAKKPPRTVDVRAAMRMMSDYDRDYVDPVVGPLRDALGFEEGDETLNWYGDAEAMRARLAGNKRAKERLAREGRPGLPG